MIGPKPVHLKSLFQISNTRGVALAKVVSEGRGAWQSREYKEYSCLRFVLWQRSTWCWAVHRWFMWVIVKIRRKTIKPCEAREKRNSPLISNVEVFARLAHLPLRPPLPHPPTILATSVYERENATVQLNKWIALIRQHKRQTSQLVFDL